MKNIHKKTTLGLFVVFLSFTAVGFLTHASKVHALDSDFSNGITVDSTLDGDDASIGNGICNDGSGNCTLRAAIEEANAHSGADTIKFNISGSGVHAIAISSGMEPLTDADTTVDGYTQTGSSANTTAWPAPFDAHITIAIDATSMPSNGTIMRISSGASGTNLRGLSLYGSEFRQVLSNDAPDVTITGSYLGIMPDGSTPSGELGRNIDSSAATATGLTLGGPNPADRNILWRVNRLNAATVEGNYFGVDPTGLVPVDSAVSLPDSCLEMANSTAGGTVTHNLVSGCRSDGAAILLDGMGGATLDGNYAGVDYTGVAALPNHGPGISVGNFNLDPTNEGDGNIVTNNVSSGNTLDGIAVSSSNNTIQGNYVGVGSDGTTLLPNSYSGLGLFTTSGSWRSDNNTVGGSSPGQGNVIAGTLIDTSGATTGGGNGLGVSGDNNVIQGNFIGTDATGSVALPNALQGVTGGVMNHTIFGGATAGEGNVVSGNNFGMSLFDVNDFIVKGNIFGLTADGTSPLPNGGDNVSVLGNSAGVLIGGSSTAEANKIYSAANAGVNVSVNSGSYVSILGNSIYNNGALGIDLNGDGVTANDAGDVDSGSNSLLNFPEYTAVTENSGDTTVDYQLDVPAGDYRIEFFGNTLADSSGYGEGEVFLGSTNVTSTGSGVQDFSNTLTGVTGVTHLAMTATLIDSGSPTGFGPTSELGRNTVLPPPPPPPTVSDLEVTQSLSNPQATVHGGTLHYTFTLTNNGPDPVDISQFDGGGGNLLASSIFLDILPVDLSYVASSSTNPNIDCGWFGAGSASLANPIYANHSDASILSCGFTGGSTTLNNGDTISTTIDVLVGSGSNLTFQNYVMGGFDSTDPDTTTYTTALDGSHDAIDYLLANPINNFSADLPTDTDFTVTQAAVDPFSATVGTTDSLDVTLSNSGPQGVDLNLFSDYNSGLFTVIYPADDLTFVDSSTAGVTCIDFGPGSIGNIGQAGIDHSTYQLVGCVYDPNSSHPLVPGGSFTSRLNFTVDPGAHSPVVNYAVNISAPGDAGAAAFLSALGSASGDILDTFSGPNLSRLVIPLASSSNNSGGGTTNTTTPPASTSSSLAGTGQNKLRFVLVAAVLIVTGLSALYWRRRRPSYSR